MLYQLSRKLVLLPQPNHVHQRQIRSYQRAGESDQSDRGRVGLEVAAKRIGWAVQAVIARARKIGVGSAQPKTQTVL